MNKVIKIILQLLAELLVFLAGCLFHALNDKKFVETLKKAIFELNELHKKALMSLRDEYEDKLKKKDEIIQELKVIIDKLIKVIEPVDNKSANTLLNRLNSSRDKLHKL